MSAVAKYERWDNQKKRKKETSIIIWQEAQLTFDHHYLAGKSHSP
jgi:hypothetical protein